MFQKTQKKKKRKKHKASIIQAKDGRCYICSSWNDDWSIKPVECHHIFGGSRRKLSEQYSLTIFLCHKHHTGSRESVHMNSEYMKKIRDMGQRAFESFYPEEDFAQIFGKNYKL